jgi:hypothetical protein
MWTRNAVSRDIEYPLLPKPISIWPTISIAPKISPQIYVINLYIIGKLDIL